MKKKLTIIITAILIIMVLVLFVPFSYKSYDDGGTWEINSLTYKAVFWNKSVAWVDENGQTFFYDNKTSVYWYPDNKKRIDELWEMEKPDITQNTPIQTETPSKSPSQTETPNNQQTKYVFKTDNIKSITFYGYYGEGVGNEVPQEYMAEITAWLATFKVGDKAPELIPPGTNTYFVEIKYSDGTVFKSGLDVINIDGVNYNLESDHTPECFWNII